MTASFTHRGRVRYAETDAMGVAHHGAYPVWLEEARIRALDELGTSYKALEATGTYMPVVDLQVRYRRPLRFDDPFVVESVLQAGPSRMCFTSKILNEQGELVAEGEVVIATIDASGVPRRIPGEITRALEERGENG